MKKSYFPAEGVWLKGNIHSHSTVSDGLFTPKELAELYHEHGYAFLSITDHNVLVPHSELPEDQIILLSGLEHDLEYSSDKCIHVVGLASAGKKETGYLCKRYSPTELKSQQLVDMMRNDGQFISLAHPVWSRMNADEIFGLEGLHAVEVFNNGTEHLCHGGNGEIWWDMLLRQGKRVFATAVDDVHIAETTHSVDGSVSKRRNVAGTRSWMLCFKGPTILPRDRRSMISVWMEKRYMSLVQRAERSTLSHTPLRRCSGLQSLTAF